MTIVTFRSAKMAEPHARSDRASEPRPTIDAVQSVAVAIAGGIIAAAPLFWAAFLLAFTAAECGVFS